MDLAAFMPSSRMQPSLPGCLSSTRRVVPDVVAISCSSRSARTRLRAEVCIRTKSERRHDRMEDSTDYRNGKHIADHCTHLGRLVRKLTEHMRLVVFAPALELK